MNKKAALYEVAEGLYVQSGFTLVQIALALNLSPRTLRNWKKEGQWDTQLVDRTVRVIEINNKTLELADSVIEKLTGRVDHGEIPDAETLRAVAQLVKAVNSIKLPPANSTA